MVELFENSGNSDQTLHSVASDLDLHCLPVNHSRVSSLQWVNETKTQFGSFMCSMFPHTTFVHRSR